MNTTLTLLLVRLAVALTSSRRRDQRGDVPGWVLVTVVTVPEGPL
jgi:hypothetical protein